ncbi:MAG: DUF2085 domain-containing protein [Bacteroidota bacterium]
MLKKINWGMLISHHPPCQYNRTISLGKYRFCARCTGIMIGIIISFLFYSGIDINLLLLLSFLLPLPAVFNFTLYEIGFINNNNFYRIITGLLLGISIGWAILNLLTNKIEYAFFSLLWIMILEIIVTIILHRAKVLEKFFAQYENGLFEE